MSHERRAEIVRLAYELDRAISNLRSDIEAKIVGRDPQEGWQERRWIGVAEKKLLETYERLVSLRLELYPTKLSTEAARELVWNQQQDELSKPDTLPKTAPAR